jgi:hypothetical protein
MVGADDVDHLVGGAEAIGPIGGQRALLQHGLDPGLDAALLKQDALQVAIGGEGGGQAAQEDQRRGAAPAQEDGPARSSLAMAGHFAF